MRPISGQSIFHPIANRPTRITPRRWRNAGAVVIAGVALGVGSWGLATWLSASTSPNPGSSAVVASPSHDLWVPASVEIVKKQLVDAGYSMPTGANLDPVTRAAAADFFGSAQHPITPALAMMLDGTVFSGRADSARWNTRFGLHRVTRLVERPLTGSGGQLDDYGNLR